MPKTDPVAELAEKTVASLRDGTFIRLTLAKPVPPVTGLEKVLARLVELKTGPHLSLTYRYPTRDVTKNVPIADVGKLVSEFRSALLSTTTRDWQLTSARLVAHKPKTTVIPPRGHDISKTGILDESARDWLEGLGVIDTTGKVRAAMADKYRQINRYLEIIAPLLKETGAKTIVDMGCGKGYLTFGVWHLLARVWNQPVAVTGVEVRPELVELTNALAQRIRAEGLTFMAEEIETVPIPFFDALIALHACDTATDDAIRAGIAAGAKLIVVAPCCHKEVRGQLGKPAPLAPVLAHGIMAERMAEWVTDGLRALHLEAAGYRTKVIEFVASEHTSKNLMIAGVRTGKPGGRERIAELKSFFGIQQHALD